MSWSSALKRQVLAAAPPEQFFLKPTIPQHVVDWGRLVSLDFETYYDDEYTLKKMSTSEYVRDPRFKAQMLGIKVGRGKTRIIPAKKIKAELAKINWSTHAALCHNTQFDGFILSHHYGIHPSFLYDTLSMARGLHSNDIGAGLDEVSIFYGGQGKIEGSLEKTKGVLDWPKAVYDEASIYCANDVDEMYRIFGLMLPKMPADEIDLIDITCRMFTSPVLKVDIPRVEKELERELARREVLMYAVVNPKDHDIGGKLYDRAQHAKLLKGPTERALVGVERDMQIIKRIIGSNEKFADLLRAEGIDPPVKISPAWMKLPKEERETPEGQARKWGYAFAKDDQKFIDLPNQVDTWGFDLNDPAQVKLMVAKQERLQALVDVRIAVKSTTNITRAQRFLTAGANGMSLPCGYAYYRAHCVPGDTEVLTPGGWRRLDEWQGGPIAQVRPDQTIEFLPAKRFVGPEVSEWVRINAPYMKGDFTQGHTMPFLKQKSFAWATETAADFVEMAVRDVPLGGQLVGTGAITAAQMRVLAMVQADGSFEEDTSIGRRLAVFVKKSRKITRARELFNQAGVRFEEQTYASWPGYVRFVVRHRDYPDWLTPARKFFGAWLLDSTPDAREALIEELQYWDGWVSAGGMLCYSSSDITNTEWVSTLSHLTGRCASTYAALNSGKRRPNYTVSIRQRNRGLVRGSHMHVARDTVARVSYCAETATGFWLARSNGRIFVTGNTGRMGGQNKMNMQNLTRGGELRLSILAPKGHVVCVQDSGQIEARVNGWLWGQTDLMDAFRAADAGTGRDAYCNFGDHIYGREITKADKTERFVGKVCLGPETIVLTNQGLKSILEVRTTDLLWDGESWVKHEGLVDQGVRTTLSHRGLSATPDHEILTEHGWLEWQEVLTDHSLFRSALSLATLPWCDGTTTSPVTGSPGVTAPSAGAHAEPSLWSVPAASRQAALRDAMHALRSRRVPSGTGSIGMLCRMTSIAHACLTVSHRRLAGVVTRTTRPLSTMVSEGFQSILAGLPTAQSSYGMFRPSRGGTFPSLSSTGSTTMVATAQATSGSPPRLSTSETSGASKTLSSVFAISKQTTQTYDLANAGPNHRFTVMTDDGPVVVHNCVLGLGFQMGAPKFQMTLAKGALGGPPVYFSLDQCKQIVNTYRMKNNRIVAGWEICKRIIEDMAAGRAGSYGPLNWEKETIWLPNGMALKYPDLRKGHNADKGWDEWTYQAKDIRKAIYGGLLCENIVQALARIIVMGQMLDISRKYRVVMTTHDETVTIAKAAQGQRCIDFMAKCMSTAPAWCSDIPLNCEGGFDVNYSK